MYAKNIKPNAKRDLQIFQSAMREIEYFRTGCTFLFYNTKYLPEISKIQHKTIKNVS